MTHKLSAFGLICLLIYPATAGSLTAAPLLQETPPAQQQGPQQQQPQEPQQEPQQESQQPEPVIEEPLQDTQRFDGPVVTYSIEARLEPEARKISGRQILVWTNTSNIPVDHLRFHLYYNAFRNENATFLRESKFYRKSKEELDQLRFGEIKITEFISLATVTTSW